MLFKLNILGFKLNNTHTVKKNDITFHVSMQLECGQVYKDIWLRHIPEQQQQTVVSHKMNTNVDRTFQK